MKNSKVKVMKVESKTALASVPNNVVALNKGVLQIKKFSKISDEVAQSDHWMRNEPIPCGMELFPQEWYMRFSDLCYPYAKGGAIYFDTPTSTIEMDRCERKLIEYRKKGVRYTFIKPHEDAADVLMRLDPVLPRGEAL